MVVVVFFCPISIYNTLLFKSLLMCGISVYLRFFLISNSITKLQSQKPIKTKTWSQFFRQLFYHTIPPHVYDFAQCPYVYTLYTLYMFLMRLCTILFHFIYVCVLKFTNHLSMVHTTRNNVNEHHNIELNVFFLIPRARYILLELLNKKKQIKMQLE